MTLGPVQLLVLGFDKPDFQGEILAEFDRLRDSDTVAMIDGLAVIKDAKGDVTVLQRSDLTEEQKAEFGAVVGALVGLGAGGLAGAEAGAVVGAIAATAGGEAIDADEIWDVIDEIPNDSAAAIILLEHRWAAPLRDAIRRAGGYSLSDGFVHPEDLVAIGLLAAAEAKALSE